MKYGLSNKQLAEIVTMIKAYREVDQAVLFGSRATDAYYEASDIDIALKGENVTSKIAFKIKSDFEDSDLPFFFDVVAYAKITEPRLKNNINRAGVDIYCRPGAKRSVHRSKWQKVKLGKVVEIKHGYAFKGPYITSKENKNILVTPGNFHIGGGFNSSKFKYFRSNFPQDYILKVDDIVVTMTDLSKNGDTLGYSAKIPKSQNNEVYLHNQRIGLLKFKSQDVNKDFIYWLMRTSEYHWFIVSAATGTSVKHTSPTTIREYKFYIPPLPEQKAIAEVLSSLDDKIDLLHRQNKTLEDIAQTLFRKWFIEEAKDDWKIGKLDNIAKISTGKGLKKSEYVSNGKYSILGANGEIGRTDNYLFVEKLIFTGRVGTLGRVFISDGKVWLSDNTLIIRSKKDFFYFVYFSLISVKLEEMNVGSTQPLIRQSDLASIKLSLPTKSRLQKFENLSMEIFTKINHNKSQISTLENLRDLLLPKLMGGKIGIK